jgi:hypothetical protein
VNKVFMLTGWGRYLARTEEVRREMEHAKQNRPKKNYGILVEDDDWALVYQRLNFRLARARRAFNPITCRSYSFTGNGPLTMKIVGVKIPGWQGSTEEEYARKNAENFDHAYRKRAVKAKRILVERHGALGGPVMALLDKQSYEETMRDVWG